MAWLYPKNGIYQIQWRENIGTDPATGKAIYQNRSQTTGMTRLSDAKVVLAKFLREQKQRKLYPEQFPDAAKMTVSDPKCDDFWAAFSKKFRDGYRPSSWDAKEWAWNRLCGDIGALVLSDITHDRLVALRASWTQAPATFNDMLRACTGIWRLGAKHHLHAVGSPFDDVKALKEHRDDLAVLSLDQVETLCWTAAARFLTPSGNRKEPDASNIHAMFILTGYFGLRSLEAENARWEWIDWTQRNFTVTQTKDFTTKNGKNRTIPLFDSAVRWLEPMRQKSGYIFRPEYEIIKRKYGRVVEYRKPWNYVCATADMPDVYPHLMRHSWITNLLYLGASPHEVADWAGHQDLYIQQHYRHAIAPKEGRTKLI